MLQPVMFVFTLAVENNFSGEIIGRSSITVTKGELPWDLLGGPVLELCTLTAEVLGSIPGQGTKIPQAKPHDRKTPKNQKMLSCVKQVLGGIMVLSSEALPSFTAVALGVPP